MKKEDKYYLLIIGLLLCITGVFLYDYSLPEPSVYEQAIQSHNFIHSSFDETNTLLQNEDFSGIIYYGYDECPWCREAVPVIENAYTELGLKNKIYYVNKRKNSDKKTEKTAADLLSQHLKLENDETGNPHIYVPMVVVVKDGEIVGGKCGTLDNHDPNIKPLTANEEYQLKKEYIELFSSLKS